MQADGAPESQKSNLGRMSVSEVNHKRNDLAHGQTIDKATAQSLRDLILGQPDHHGLLRLLAELAAVR